MHDPAYELRPLGLGEILDRSVNFWRAHLLPLFKLYLVMQLLIYGVTKVWSLAFASFLTLMQDQKRFEQVLREDMAGTMTQLAGYFVSLFALLFFLIWLYWVSAAIATRFTLGRLMGQPVTMGEAVSMLFARLGRLSGALLLSLLWMAGVTLLAIIPMGLVAGLAALTKVSGLGIVILSVLVGLAVVGIYLLALLWWVLRFWFVVPAIMMEDLGAFASIRRAGELMSGRIGPGFLDRVKVRATVLLTVMTLIVWVAMFLGALPAFVLSFVYGVQYGAAMQTAIPQYLLVPAELLQVVFSSLIAPLSTVFGALFYLDLRVRREGLDLQQKLATAAA